MEMIEIKITYNYMYQESIYVKKDELLLCNVVGSADSDDDSDYDNDDEDGYDGCCDDCGCYHGHHPWCGESSESDDDW